MVIVFQPALQRGSGVDDLKQTECGFGRAWITEKLVGLGSRYVTG